MEMNIYQILDYLPHRYPFLLIDKVKALEAGKFISALKNVTINEHFFTGHFPERPVMPGVIILEAMAQAAGILALATQKRTNPREAIYFLAGIDNARFKHIVTPGDQLHFYLTIERSRQDVWKFNGTASVDDAVVCTADLMIAGRKA